MRIIGLDIGERRVGVAVSDAEGKIATPVTVLDSQEALHGRKLLDIIDDYEASMLVLGIPLSLDGTEGPQARRVREVGDGLADRLGVPIVYHDERLTSAEASRLMSEAGVSSRKQRGRLDMVAASLILQGYLDSKGDSTEGSESNG